MVKIRVLTVIWRCYLKAKVLTLLGGTVQQCRGLCARSSRLMECIETNDRSILCYHKHHRASTLLLTVVDKCQYLDALLQVCEAGECNPSMFPLNDKLSR